jgi:hypothetical protein
MKHLITALALAFAASASFAASHAGAAPMEKKKTPQQEKMAMCNKEAAGKKGDERKAFMKECLGATKSAAAAPAGKTPQQQKMAACNKEAAGKTGDARKAFMKECLSKA